MRPCRLIAAILGLLLGAGAAIGTRLHISERTARNHVSAILAKLGINTRAQAIVRGREAGFGGQMVR